MRHGFIYLLRAGIGMLAFASAVAAEGLTETCEVLPPRCRARGAGGLRLGNMRSALALDVAVPLQVNSSMRDVQFLVQTKYSF
jgi:hypothetical protein